MAGWQRTRCRNVNFGQAYLQSAVWTYARYGGDFGDFGVSETATVAWRYTRRGGPRRSVQGEPLVVLTRGP